MQEIIMTIAPSGTAKIIFTLFLILTIVDWWMSVVQNTTYLIIRENNAPRELIQFLNPFYLQAATLITLIKWVIAAIYAWQVSWKITSAWLFGVWFISLFGPKPFSLTLRSVNKKVNIVYWVDTQLGKSLMEMVDRWAAGPRKRF